MANKTPPPSGGLILVRLVTGWLLMSQGWDWLSNGGFDGLVLAGYVEEATREPGMSTKWAELVLLPNPEGAAFLGRALAFLLGLCLLCGALTRPAGIGASLLCLHGYAYGAPETELTFLLLAVCAFACGVSCAGRRFGLDPLLDENLPTWLTWTKRKTTFLS